MIEPGGTVNHRFDTAVWSPNVLFRPWTAIPAPGAPGAPGAPEGTRGSGVPYGGCVDGAVTDSDPRVVEIWVRLVPRSP
ncbi:hypothetical protein BO226_03030 [Rhodococcus sp. 2G]|nr:hypothetical protein BO226_03030 [Rhodococcus sp. 2G]